MHMMELPIEGYTNTKIPKTKREGCTLCLHNYSFLSEQTAEARNSRDKELWKVLSCEKFY